MTGECKHTRSRSELLFMQGNVSEESKELWLFYMWGRERNILSESKVTLNVAAEIKWVFQLVNARAAFLKDSFFLFHLLSVYFKWSPFLSPFLGFNLCIEHTPWPRQRKSRKALPPWMCLETPTDQSQHCSCEQRLSYSYCHAFLGLTDYIIRCVDVSGFQTLWIFTTHNKLTRWENTGLFCMLTPC